MSGELPGQVLCELREKHHRSRRVFGDMVGWGGNVQRNLEQGRTRFTDEHLKTLVTKLEDVGWIKHGDEWYIRFQQAIEYEWQLDRDKDKEGDDREEVDILTEEPDRPSQYLPMIVPQPRSRERQRRPWLPIAGTIAVVLLLIGAIYGGYRLGARSRDEVRQQDGTPPVVMAESGSPVAPGDGSQMFHGTPDQPVVPATFTPEPSPTSTFTPPPTYTPYPTYTEVPTFTPKPNPTSTPYPTATPYPTYTPYPPLPPTSTVPPDTATPPQTPTETLVPTPAVTLPFRDNFNDGLSDLWEVQSGTWRIVDGVLNPDPDCRNCAIFVGDESWTDYAVKVDLVHSCATNERVFVRVTADSYMMFEISTLWVKLIVSNQGQKTEIASNRITTLPCRMQYNIRIEAKGPSFLVYLNGDHLMSATDSMVVRGRVGLGASNSESYYRMFDNFEVTPLG